MNTSSWLSILSKAGQNVATLFWTVKFTTGPTHFSIFHMNVNYNIALKCIVWCRMYIYKHWLFCNNNITSDQRHFIDLIQSQLNAWKISGLSKLKGLIFLATDSWLPWLLETKMVKLIPTDWCSNTFFFIPPSL